MKIMDLLQHLPRTNETRGNEDTLADADCDFPTNVSESDGKAKEGRYSSLSIQLRPTSEPLSPSSMKAFHSAPIHSIQEESDAANSLDFTRTDVSLVRQLLEQAMATSQKRTSMQRQYTDVACIPSAEIISSLLSNLAADKQKKERNKDRSKTSVSFSDHARAYMSRRKVQTQAIAEDDNTLLSRDQVSEAAQLVGTATIEDVGECKVFSASISYPEHWNPPASLPLSPFHADNGNQSELEIISWCSETLGDIIVTPAMKERLLLLQSAKWAAFLAPFAGDEYVTLIGRFLAVFVIIDDLLVEEAFSLGLTARQMQPFYIVWSEAANRARGDRVGTNVAYMELTQLGFSTHNPLLTCCLDGFTALADDYVQLGADTVWCSRMAAVVHEYVELGIREAMAGAKINETSMLCQEHSSRLPAMEIPLTEFDHPSLHTASRDNNGKIGGMAILEVLARQRIASIGWPMLTLQLERACGLQLTLPVAQALEPAIQIASLIPALVNEMIGLARDLREGSTLIAANFSLVQRRLFKCSLSQIVDFALALHSAAITAFDNYSRIACEHPAVVSYYKLKTRIPVFLERLRHGVRGYAHWHGHAARYKAVMAVDLTLHQCFMFPVLDGHDEHQKFAAIADALHQYTCHIQNNNLH